MDNIYVSKKVDYFALRFLCFVFQLFLRHFVNTLVITISLGFFFKTFSKSGLQNEVVVSNKLKVKN